MNHLGLSLKRAAERWETEFATAMSARGHDFIAEGRGQLFRFIPRTGIAQSALAAETGLTKQAVQQHLDALVADGLVKRVADPSDSRRKWVQPTEAGQRALSDGEAVVIELDGRLRSTLGSVPTKRLARLSGLLSQAEDSPLASNPLVAE